MGNVQSRKRQTSVKNASQDQQSQSTVESTLEDYVVIVRDTRANKQTVLEFNPANSRAVCVGIDKQKNHNFIGNNLGDVAAKNATLLGESFVTDFGIQKECVDVFTASDRDTDLCEKIAIKTHIIRCAREVEEDGMFAFYFSGHVVVYKDLNDKDEWVHVLVPADFAGDVKTGITVEDFVSWIQKANCKARHILIILDCCYAGGIGKKITSTVDVKPQIHVMCACAAKEVTLPMNILGSSIFCYFLRHVLKKQQPKGRFALDEDMDEVAELCQSFSSLLMCYSSERGGLLRPALLQPEVHRSGNDEVDIPDGDNSDGTHGLNKLFGLYDKQAKKPSIHPVAQQWLNSRVVQESVRMLLSINPPPESLYNGVLCALFYSVSCIHLAYDRTHITERNLFITAAISIVSAIGYSYPDINITEQQLTLGLKFYYLPINSAGSPTGSLEKLFMELHVNGGTNDQNTLNQEVNLLSQWKPL